MKEKKLSDEEQQQAGTISPNSTTNHVNNRVIADQSNQENNFLSDRAALKHQNELPPILSPFISDIQV